LAMTNDVPASELDLDLDMHGGHEQEHVLTRHRHIRRTWFISNSQAPHLPPPLCRRWLARSCRLHLAARRAPRCRGWRLSQSTILPLMHVARESEAAGHPGCRSCMSLAEHHLAGHPGCRSCMSLAELCESQPRAAPRSTSSS